MMPMLAKSKIPENSAIQLDSNGLSIVFSFFRFFQLLLELWDVPMDLSNPGPARLHVAWQASHRQCKAPWLQALQSGTQLEEQRHRESLVKRSLSVWVTEHH